EGADAAWQAAKAQIETKRARSRAASADLEVAESRIKVADAEVHNLSVLISYATIRAPFDGVITKRWVDRGATIKDPGMPLLTVMRTDVVRVILDVPERDAPYLRVTGKPSPEVRGNKVWLRFPALEGVVGNREFTGSDGERPPRLTRTTSALDPMTRTMR